MTSTLPTMHPLWSQSAGHSLESAWCHELFLLHGHLWIDYWSLPDLPICLYRGTLNPAFWNWTHSYPPLKLSLFPVFSNSRASPSTQSLKPEQDIRFLYTYFQWVSSDLTYWLALQPVPFLLNVTVLAEPLIISFLEYCSHSPCSYPSSAQLLRGSFGNTN